MDRQTKGAKKEYIRLHPSDNTATALADLPKGETLHLDGGKETLSVTLTEPIPFADKFAILPIPQGGEVKKYGELIGDASLDIEAGEYVHVHNLVSRRTRGQGR
jgi:altronate dehydratase small subunit